MNETTTTTYGFFDLSGQLLEIIDTNNPESHTGELSHFHGVDADEIEYEPVNREDWE